VHGGTHRGGFLSSSSSSSRVSCRRRARLRIGIGCCGDWLALAYRGGRELLFPVDGFYGSLEAAEESFRSDDCAG